MKKSRKIVLGVLFCLILLGITVVGTFRTTSHADNNNLTLYGNVDIREVDLGFRVMGKLQELYFEEGDYIKKAISLPS
jgi:HlyD family secretion protein